MYAQEFFTELSFCSVDSLDFRGPSPCREVLLEFAQGTTGPIIGLCYLVVLDHEGTKTFAIGHRDEVDDLIQSGREGALAGTCFGIGGSSVSVGCYGESSWRGGTERSGVAGVHYD